MHSDGAIQSSRVEGRLESFLVKGEVYCLTSNPDPSYLVARKSQNICQQETHASGGPCQTSKNGKLG
jgi:hypothetical protein